MVFGWNLGTGFKLSPSHSKKPNSKLFNQAFRLQFCRRFDQHDPTELGGKIGLSFREVSPIRTGQHLWALQPLFVKSFGIEDQKVQEILAVRFIDAVLENHLGKIPHENPLE